jgi:hypothetical protein
LLTTAHTIDLTTVPTTNMAFPTITEETLESVDDIPMVQPFGVEDGSPESAAAAADDALSQSSGITS